MANSYSMEDLLDFLDHAGDRGLMPAATAQALAVASRKVLGILSDQEKKDLSQQDMDSVIRRFTNKRAKDFNPSSLKEYGRRVHRAVELFLQWREDPANFRIRTRITGTARRKDKIPSVDNVLSNAHPESFAAPVAGTYQSSVPVRPGVVVTLLNVPHDLTKAEADRIASFVKMLAVET